jgi:hypothetical protein
MINGLPQNGGVYIWVLNVIDQVNNALIEKKGNFSLIR